MKTKYHAFFRKYSSYLVLAFLFFLLAIVLKNLQNKERKTTFHLNFLERYKDVPTLEIAGFEEGENWKGNFTRDSGRTFDGDTGMNIFTQGKPNVITLNKPFDLFGYDNVYAYLYLDSEDEIRKIDSVVFGFRDKDDKGASFKVPTLKAGWNLLSMPKSKFVQNNINWKEISAVNVELIPTKGNTAQIALDRIWAQKPLKNTADFISYVKEYMNLKTLGKKTYLHLGSPFLTHTLFSKNINNDFSYTISLAPKKLGLFGLSFQTDTRLDNGYFFSIGGAQMDSWMFYKKEGGNTLPISNGRLKSNIFEKEAYLWLRVEKKGKDITFSYSVNNQLYVPIKELEDSSFSKGYMGIFSQGSYLINSVEVKE